MTYAATADVQDRLGRSLTADEAVQAAALLNDAEILIRSKIPDLHQVVGVSVPLELVVMVEANAVVRLLRSPNGYVSEAYGTYSYTTHRRSAAGMLTITTEEWSRLGVITGIFVINPTP